MLTLSLAVVGCASGCSAETRPEAVDGTLVLELGGSSPSLRESLRAAGVVLEMPVEPEVRPIPAPDPRDLPREDPPRADPEPQPPTPPPAYREVELRKNETLIHLAQRHLGNGRRYRQIMTLNGWSDADTRRLREGTMVKIPIDR